MEMYSTLLINREDNALKFALQTVTDSGLIRSKQDYMAIYKVMCDVIYHCHMSCPAFIRQLDRYNIVFPSNRNIRPTADNIRKIKFHSGSKYVYPNWRFIEGTPEQLMRYKEIASAFLNAYYSLMN